MDVPEGASREDVLMYVVDAVATMKGCLRPPGGDDEDDTGDPMFGLDGSSVCASFATTKQNRRRIVRCRYGD